MAKAIMKMPEDFLMKVSKLESKTDEILPRVLESGAEVVEAKVRTNLSAVVGANTKLESRSTGELERALGTSQARQDKDGNWNILEYGRHGQAPKPFLKPAKSQSRKSCIETMKAKLESEVESI